MTYQLWIRLLDHSLQSSHSVMLYAVCITVNYKHQCITNKKKIVFSINYCKIRKYAAILNSIKNNVNLSK